MEPPRTFFVDFVLRSYEAFRTKPHGEYEAKMAVISANDMAERMLHGYSGTARVYGFKVGQEYEYRNALAQKECDDFALVRDVAEGHKHVKLTRRSKTRRVSSATQTGAHATRFVNNAGEPVTFVNNAGDPVTFVSNVIVTLDDDSTRPLLPVVEAVVAMWDRLSSP